MAKRVSRTFLLAACCASLACGVLACDETIEATKIQDSGAASDGATNDSGTTAASSLELNVTYNGAQKGPLLASVWPTPKPGVGTPAGIGSNETPTWPGSNVVKFKTIAAGHYFVFTYIMVGPEHRTGPTPQDPAGPPVEVDIKDGQTTTANAMLFDPKPDAGSDAGDAGDGGAVSDASDSG